MANALYDKARESFLKGEINFTSNNIKAMLADSALYTPNLATHQFLTDIPSGARVAISANMASKTTAAGVADCADFSFTTVTGAVCAYVVFYQDTGSAATSRLICCEDTATNLPLTPNGADIDVVIDSGANKLFKL